MLTGPLQNIDQVGARIDTLQLAGNQQALYHAYPSSAQFRPIEHPVPPTHRDLANAELQMIRIQSERPVLRAPVGTACPALCPPEATCRRAVTRPLYQTP